MPPSTRLRPRLAAADQRLLRQPGPAGDAERRSLLSGSRVAVISPGYEGKRFLYERAHELGVELVLLGEPDNWSRILVDEGIADRYLEMELLGDPDLAAETIIQALGDEAAGIDGIVTFWEDAVPAAMRVAEILGLPGSPPAAADAARSKERTLAASRAAGLPTAGYVRLSGASSLRAAADQVGFPAVLKPSFGAEAHGVIRVDDLAGLEAAFGRVSLIVTPDFDPIFEQGTDLLLVEYLDGVEYDVDIVLSDGRCVFATVSENWPTDEPYFAETGLYSPAPCSPGNYAELVRLTTQTAFALGFRDAALHTEAKYTTQGGPRLLEVNARLAGGRIVQYHRMITGVDLIEIVLLLAVGVPVAPVKNAEPACGVAAAFMHAPRSGILRGTGFLEHLAGDPAVFQADVTATAGEALVAASDGFPSPLAEISVMGPDVPSAFGHLQRILEGLDIPIDATATAPAPEAASG